MPEHLQPVAETKTVAKEESSSQDLSLEAFAELPEVGFVQTLETHFTMKEFDFSKKLFATL